ncbi:MAG TPA: ATP-binding protein [Chitinophagaceae bacterium]|jgi:PAS domain S-box-containing protein
MLKGNQIRIAIVDDDEDDFFIIKDYIKAIEGGNFVIDWLNEYKIALDKIGNKVYDIYFVDFRLGNETGLDLLQEALNLRCDRPIVLLTGKGNKTIDIKAMQTGATDYLVKSDLNTEKLERCIRYSLERAESLRELKSRENKYRNLFEGSKDAVFISDENLFFTECNKAASLLLGFQNGELLHHSLFEFIAEDSQKENLRRILRDGENVSDVELQIKNGNGEIKSCLLFISFQKDSLPHHLINGIIHDITNIKKAEQANIQTQKLAATERLIRILAHEIRNPLNNINLAADQLQVQKAVEEKEVYLVDIIQRNCTRINKIISELVDLTRPLELRLEAHSLQEILDESLSLATDRINLQHINVKRNYPDMPGEISADKSKLVIAFTNLIINAIEAIEKDNGELVVSISKKSNGYSVSIVDNGKGIPQEYLPKLFEPFFTSKKNGMGLGLAACHSIIESHQGTIHVESEVNKGSNFVVDFKQ